MPDIYAALQVSPRKKRRSPPEFDDDTVLTPKRLRIAPPTPPPTSTRKTTEPTDATLPAYLSRLCNIYTALQHALSHALATCAVSPSSDTGLVKNVLNHLSLTTYAGLSTQFDLDDLRRLCWVWEWDGKFLEDPAKKTVEDEDNPFLENPVPSSSAEWTRGSMGLILSPTTYYSKAERRRLPVYGVGIEVEMDIDKDMGGGMAAVARWTAGADSRRAEFQSKIKRWVKLHADSDFVPNVPLANLPKLASTSKVSNLTRTLASASPKGAISALTLPGPPSSPSRSMSKSPVKKIQREFAIPFPSTPSRSSTPTKNSILFPKTPSRHSRPDPQTSLLTPRTPSTPRVAVADTPGPSTPIRQRGADAVTVPQTPTSSRRQALYERVRLRSLTASPTKAPSSEIKGGKLSRDQILKMGQEEMRRRCLLGRLSGVAESIWMLFSTPATGVTATPSSRKRRAMLLSEVITAVIKSSPVPISTAEANESISMLTKLCPFFLKPLTISGAEWLEMPATQNLPTATTASDATPRRTAPPSPGPARARGKDESAEELLTRSPKRVKKEAGGLRDVREIIRRELELQD